jgi:hypothetical protein
MSRVNKDSIFAEAGLPLVVMRMAIRRTRQPKKRADAGWYGIRALLKDMGFAIGPYAARTVERNLSTSSLR